jgi:hypothetical protein
MADPRVLVQDSMAQACCSIARSRRSPDEVLTAFSPYDMRLDARDRGAQQIAVTDDAYEPALSVDDGHEANMRPLHDLALHEQLLGQKPKITSRRPFGPAVATDARHWQVTLPQS